MQELTILLSSLAGAATAVAVNKFPRSRIQLQSLGASSQIKNQINSLRMEKDILTKTITRLYQSESEITRIQRDKLLLKYQHQLGIVLAKLEKLEAASQHPDLGPVGDGLITLMDQKLSQIDSRLFELSSKMTVAKTEITKKETTTEIPSISRKESNNVPAKTQVESKNQAVFIPPTKTNGSFELTTLTRLSTKTPTFPLIEEKQKLQNTPKSTVQPVSVSLDNQKVRTKPEIIHTKETGEATELKISPDEINAQFSRLTTMKALSGPKEEIVKIPENEYSEDDDDLDKIKNEIMKALSKLEQAEVE